MKTISSNDKSHLVNTKLWDDCRNVIRTHKGGAIIGEGIVTCKNYSLLDDLVGNASFFQVLILNITGILPENRLATWVETTFICLSWPDSRIWCNQIGSLGGTMKASPVSSIVAGILASDSKLYGPGTVIAATNFITNALSLIRKGKSIENILKLYSRNTDGKPIIPGYARPIAYGDERVYAMEGVTKELGFEIGDHLRLAYEIQDILYEKFNESINLSGYIMAFLSDQGLSANEIYRLYSLCVNSGVHACYSESYDNPAETFLPLRCDDIEYQGKDPRRLPKNI